MIKKIRYSRHLEFPPYAFIPGKALHPEKPGGHLYGHSIEVSRGPNNKLSGSRDFHYGVDLFNHSYPWEAHVWWEALWNDFGRKNGPAKFLQALIKASAAQVKVEMEQLMAARGHLDRALDLLTESSNNLSYPGPLELPANVLVELLTEWKKDITLIPEISLRFKG